MRSELYLRSYFCNRALPDALDEYAREVHQPISTFNDIFNVCLKDRGSDEERRYKWSVKRSQELLNSILKRFRDTEGFQN